MGYDLALGVSTAVLTLLGAWRGRLRFTAVNAFLIAWVALVAFPSLFQFAGVVTVAKERLFLATTIVNVAVSIAVLVRTSRWFDDVLGAIRDHAKLKEGFQKKLRKPLASGSADIVPGNGAALAARDPPGPIRTTGETGETAIGS